MAILNDEELRNVRDNLDKIDALNEHISDIDNFLITLNSTESQVRLYTEDSCIEFKVISANKKLTKLLLEEKESAVKLIKKLHNTEYVCDNRIDMW